MGGGNESVAGQARRFLAENRALVGAVFKRHAGIGGEALEGAAGMLGRIVDGFVLLMALAGYLQEEGMEGEGGQAGKHFS